uniref:RCC1-like domain-containing protein n=1 Tax=Clastoptera arizonana TaxID=38151 RepID=A0A1B6CWH0_9HEMI
MAVEEKDDLKLFTLSKVASTSELSFSVFNSAPGREQLALVLQCGDLLFFNLTSTNVSDAIHYIPWFEGSKKRIEAATFDPLFGLWLLVACCDGSLHVVPSLVPLKITNSLDGLDSDWSLDDVTSLPPICDNGMLDIVPTAIAWWDRIESEGRCRNVAIVGGSNGEILLADMVSGAVLGRTNVKGRVMTIEICKDDDVIDLSPVFLLITNDARQQWKLVLEDHENNYSWPFPHQPSRASSRASLISGAGSEESVSRPSLTSFPLTRARLQGLKQLSVEKLATLRQKLSETRNRGLNVTLKRRGSSSSEESLTKQLRSSAVSSDNESTIKLSNDGDPKLISIKDSFLSLQVERNRRVVTAHYPPSQLFTVYNVSINPSPGFVHKLSPTSHNILLTNWLLYIVDTNNKCLSVVSNRLSQCRIDSQKQFLNSDFNPDTVLQEFLFLEEEILYLYRLTPLLQENEIGKENETSLRTQLNKANASSHNDRFPINGCIVVTNKNIYKVITRKEPDEIVLNCVLDPKKLEKAERLCMIFGLNLQQLIEAAATRQLERGQLTSALYLYKMARCRPVKSLLRMASAGYTEQLLYLTYNQQTNILQTSQLSQSEALHLSNLCVLTLTEQYLRQKTTGKLTANFKWFLKENQHYDEVFAVGVIGQSGICSILNFLCDQRGLATQVLDVLCTIIRQQHSPKLDFDLCDGFWDCMTNEKLCQSLVTNPDIAKAHLRFLKNRMTSVDENTLQRLAKLYDPSQPSVRPALQRLMLDYLDNESIYSANSKSRQEDDQFLLSDWLAGYFVTCFYLNLVRRKYENCYYEVDLLVESEHNSTQHTVQSKGHLAVSCNTISAGNTHVALVRNGSVYVWGHAAYGCLGIGPIISQSVMPTQVPFFYVLGIQVLSVACGKAHTLALTDNGLYSWGSSKYGQLGIGVTSQSSEPRLIERLYNERVTSVMAGQYHSLALTTEGWLYTWGWGVHGQLGHNSVEDCHYPCRVEALLAEVCVACSGGHAHTIVLTSTGRVWAFGSSVFGQLGTGSNAKSNHPVQVFGLPEKITAISTAYFHNLALAASNRLYTWGSSPQVLRLQAQAQKKSSSSIPTTTAVHG